MKKAHYDYADDEDDSDDVENGDEDCESDDEDDEEECVTEVSKKRTASAFAPKRPAGKAASKGTSVIDKTKKTKPIEKEKKDMTIKFKQFFLKKDAVDRSYGAYTTRASKGVGSLLGAKTSTLAYAVAAHVCKDVHSSS